MTDNCACGSGEPKYALYDARGIFCRYVCTACEEEKRRGFRADIFSDSKYWTDEPVDAE